MAADVSRRRSALSGAGVFGFGCGLRATGYKVAGGGWGEGFINPDLPSVGTAWNGEGSRARLRRDSGTQSAQVGSAFYEGTY